MRSPSRTKSATAPRAQLRERERGMETSRQQVLRLLGEASTLEPAGADRPVSWSASTATSSEFSATKRQQAAKANGSRR